MIFDDVTIEIKAGQGGDGAASFRREKFVPRGGPDGGNGGKGASVYFEAVNDITALRYFRFKKHIKADRGTHGKGKKKHGKNAEDLVIKIPVGTTVTNLQSGYVWEFDTVGMKKRVARGGNGGRGNFEFLSNENRAPDEAEEGAPGEVVNLNLSLAFIADIGLIGLPSAGKSSLLNALTEAEVKVGAYPFTTLEANLGALGGTIIADIPGLIEGAHGGKGLGIKFLKHIEKTKVLVHCVDVTSEDVVKDYKTIREELKEYNPELLEKKEIILLTKTDLVDEKEIESQKKKMDKFGEVHTVSIIDDDRLKKLHTVLTSI